MRIWLSALLFSTLTATSISLAQQTAPAPPPTIGGSSYAPENPDPVAPLVQPAIDSLQKLLPALKVEKWKGGSVRNEAASNITSIQKEVQTTLPALLAEIDSGPASASKVFSVSQNLTALYEVLIRVWGGARVAAKADQIEQLQQGMVSVDKARHAVDERLLSMTVGTQKQVTDLQTELAKAEAVVPCPVVAPPPPPPPAPKKKVVKKKPATPASTKPGSGTPGSATPGSGTPGSATPGSATPAPASTKPNP